METFIVIVVLIILFVLLGGAAWFFGKEAGPGSNTAWITGTRQIRSMFSQIGSREAPFTSRSQSSAVMVDDTRMHELAEELREEITRTLAIGEGLENRLRLLEHEMGQTKSLPESIDARVKDVETTINARVIDAETNTNSRLAKIRNEIKQNRQADSPYGIRRNDAIRDLYQKLAQIDVALGAVVNPMLLPGEPVSVPETLYEDTMEWDNWGDVADKAFAFGEAFSKNRVLLDQDLAQRIEKFISTFRESLTGTVYPIVQGTNITAAQKEKMRAGIVTVVDGITPIRRELESDWLKIANIHNEEEDDRFDA